MAKKIFKKKVRFVFDGFVSVSAESSKEAKEQIEKHFGLVIGGDLHTASDQITDWEFSVHPEKRL